MTEKEAIIQLNFDMEMIRFNPDTGENFTLEQIKAHNKENYNTYVANEVAITALTHVMDLKEDLQSEIHRLENRSVDKTISDEEKVKLLVALECYSKVLNQLNWTLAGKGGQNEK